jgi:hypothetical protein
MEDMNSDDTIYETSVDEEVATLLRLEAHRVGQMLDAVGPDAPSKFIDLHSEVQARLRWLAIGLEKGRIVDARGDQTVVVDLTNYDETAAQ